MNIPSKIDIPIDSQEIFKRDDLVLKGGDLYGKISLRVNAGDGGGDDGNVQKIAKQIVGADLPVIANSFTAKDDETFIFWVGPDEWLIHLRLSAVSETIQSLKEHLKDMPHAVVDVSDYYMTLRLVGADAAEVLAHGCPLDLRSNQFKKGQCAGSHYLKAQIFLAHVVGDVSEYMIQCRWSYADYLKKHLMVAMKLL